MGRLIYAAITSLDGYIADENGSFDWAVPDEELHGFVNDLQRPVGTYLYGRRMYEVMSGWEQADTFADQRPVMQDFARLWQAADKIVYSRTLAEVSTAGTRLVPHFDPAGVRRLKAELDRDLTIGGPGLAAEAFRAGLVDECQLILMPIVVGGGGTPSLPARVRIGLELAGERRFGSGAVYLHYRVAA